MFISLNNAVCLSLVPKIKWQVLSNFLHNSCLCRDINCVENVIFIELFNQWYPLFRFIRNFFPLRSDSVWYTIYHRVIRALLILPLSESVPHSDSISSHFAPKTRTFSHRWSLLISCENLNLSLLFITNTYFLLHRYSTATEESSDWEGGGGRLSATFPTSTPEPTFDTEGSESDYIRVRTLEDVRGKKRFKKLHGWSSQTASAPTVVGGGEAKPTFTDISNHFYINSSKESEKAKGR